MAEDPDPTALIRDHCSDLPPPQWVSDAYDFTSDKTGHCFHCHERFIPFLQIGRISKHHCRLCGELVCRSCTSKLKVAAKFEKKSKEHSRVCHACLFSVLVKRVIAGETAPAVKTRVTKYVWGSGPEPPTLAEKQKLLPRVFWMPEWVNVHDTSACFICHYITERRHHCRLCGLLFCGDCSQKMSDVPQMYDQKNKPGGKRVCNYCRFCLARGWRFQYPGEKPTASNYKIQADSGGAPLGYTQDSSTASSASSASTFKPIAKSAPPPAFQPIKQQNAPTPVSTNKPPIPIQSAYGGSSATSSNNSAAGPPRPPVRGGASTPSGPAPPVKVHVPAGPRPLSQCSMSTCTSPATVAGFCAKHDVDNSALPKNTPAGFEVVVRVRFEEDANPFTAVQALGHADLHALHNLVTNAYPSLDSVASSLQYIVRGRAVQKMHWRMFEARFCVPELILKKLQPFDHKSIVGTTSSAPVPSPAATPSSVAPPPAAARPPVIPPRSTPAASPLPSRQPSPVRTGSAATPPPAAGAPLTREQLLAQSKPSRAVKDKNSPAASRVASPAVSRKTSPVGLRNLQANSPPPPVTPAFVVSVNRPAASQAPPPVPSPQATSVQSPIHIRTVPPPAPTSRPPFSAFPPPSLNKPPSGPPPMPGGPPVAKKWPQVKC